MRRRFVAERVVFDLDGTVVDSAPDLCAAMNFVLRTMGRPELPLSDVRAMIGHGARALIERGLSASGPLPSDTDMTDLLQQFLTYYSANVARQTRPFPGARHVLGTLEKAGHRLGLCTNKPQALTEKLMASLALDRHFQVMVGGDYLPVRKPQRGHLDHVLDVLGGDGPSVMIGDSETDVAAARASGIPVILVDFGYSPVPVADLGADIVISSLDDLKDIIHRI